MTNCHKMNPWVCYSIKKKEGMNMKYCSHCGKEIMDEAVVCVNCGCAVVVETPKKTGNDGYWDTKSNATGTIVCAFLFPLLGLIFGIIGVGKCTDPQLRGKYTAAIVLSFVAWIFWAIIISALLS